MIDSSAPTASQLYDEAFECCQNGDFQDCRSLAERALEHLSRRESLRIGGSSAVQDHYLFCDLLLLLSNMYSAVGDFVEAERLLSTCTGYIDEHFNQDHPTLAAVLYNRAVLRVEVYRQSGAAEDIEGVREARDVYLVEAERYLINAQDAKRFLLADVLHCRGVCSYLLEKYIDALGDFQRSLGARAACSRSASSDEVEEASIALKTALTMEHVAHIYRLWGGRSSSGGDRLVMALHLLDVVATTRKKHLGTAHPLYSSAQFAHGVCAAQLRKNTVAASSLLEAWTSAKKVYPAGDPRVAEIEYWLREVRQTHEQMEQRALKR